LLGNSLGPEKFSTEISGSIIIILNYIKYYTN
jgi:hypothetical protein